MASTEFSDLYRSVHGRDPFPWQERLAKQVLAEGWPEIIAVPTACGKTSVIDIAVFALALQSERPAVERTAPLRVFFVIDRRLVVDDVARHAQKVADKVNESAELGWMRERLKTFRGALPLATAVLRGGMYRSDVWADQPNQPLGPG